MKLSFDCFVCYCKHRHEIEKQDFINSIFLHRQTDRERERERERERKRETEREREQKEREREDHLS